MIAMEEVKEKFAGKGKKTIFFLGVLGIILIFLSSMLPKSAEKSEVKDNISAEEYCLMLEKKVESIVIGITGDKKVSAMVTLDTGSQYVYADEGRQTVTEKGNDTEQSYTIIKSSGGGENGLLVTEYMPTVRGVAVVCNITGADMEERIRAALMAALDIQNKKIYVTGYTY